MLALIFLHNLIIIIQVKHFGLFVFNYGALMRIQILKIIEHGPIVIIPNQGRQRIPRPIQHKKRRHTRPTIIIHHPIPLIILKQALQTILQAQSNLLRKIIDAALIIQNLHNIKGTHRRQDGG
jgi:hypothetical protein